MYDSRTDRADFSGPRFVTDKPWHLQESAPPKVSRSMKRLAAKRDRRSEFPRTQFRGYGWGDSNLRSLVN